MVTSTTPEKTWANTRVIAWRRYRVRHRTEAATRQRYRRARQHHADPIALEQGLVDELRLVIAPALHLQRSQTVRRGSPRRLRLTRNVDSPSGYLLLDFRSAAESPFSTATAFAARAGQTAGVRLDARSRRPPSCVCPRSGRFPGLGLSSSGSSVRWTTSQRGSRFRTYPSRSRSAFVRRVCIHVKKVLLEGEEHGMRAVTCAEALEDVLDMCLDRFSGYAEL